MRSLHLPYMEFAPLPVYEVEALHDMAMGGIKQCVVNRGVRVHSDRLLRKHIYVVFNDSGGAIGDDQMDTYLGVRVIKQAAREWRMTISFLDNDLRVFNAASNKRELNTFIWNDSQAYGLRRVREAIGRVMEPAWMSVGERKIFVGRSDETVRHETRVGLTVVDCDNIAKRMCEEAAGVELSIAA